MEPAVGHFGESHLTSLARFYSHHVADAVRRAVAYAKYPSRSRSHRAITRVFNEEGNVIETHEHAGDFKESVTRCETKSRHALKRDG